MGKKEKSLFRNTEKRKEEQNKKRHDVRQGN